MRRGLKREKGHIGASREYRVGGAASPMRRGLKQRKEQTWQAMPRRRRRRLPDEKGIETNWARLPRLAGYSGGAASPMRRGLKHVATTSPRDRKSTRLNSSHLG